MSILKFFDSLVKKDDKIKQRITKSETGDQKINPINIIQFDKVYKSSPKASTDLHAGGVFFCVPYEEMIKFSKRGKVVITRKVIETFRPMDGQHEIDQINNFKLKGKYTSSSGNYIRCNFDNFTMIGLPLELNHNILTFHCHCKNSGRQFGEAYKLCS